MGLKTRAQLFMLILFLFAIDAKASAQETCLSYDMDGVQLTGTISKKTFPGPPNYESIRCGDKPETYWILHLVKPICMQASGDNDAEKNVTDLQLILPSKTGAYFKKDYARFTKFASLKENLMVVGKLMHAITGHHHTPLLIEVKSIVLPHKPLQF